jgi:hypothetical protein
VVRHNTEGGLKIGISNLKPAFEPGDTIEGTVELCPGHGPYDLIILELTGQSWCYVAMGDGMDMVEGSALAPLVKVPITLNKDGPLQISDAPRIWPFSVQIPKTIIALPEDADAVERERLTLISNKGSTAGERFTMEDHLDWPVVRRDRHMPYASNKTDVKGMLLPTSFYGRRAYKTEYMAQETRGEGYVEYFLRCSGHLSPDTSRPKAGEWIGTRKQRHTSTYPLLINIPGPECADFMPSDTRHKFDLKTSALAAPPDSDHRVSLRSRLSQRIHGDTPRYGFYVFVESPQVIQLAHPDPLPIKIWMHPIMHPDYTNMSKDACPPIRLCNSEISLKGTYHLRAPSDIRLVGMMETEQVVKYPLASSVFDLQKLDAADSIIQPLFTPDADAPDCKDRGVHSLVFPGPQCPSYPGPAPEGAYDLGALYQLRIEDTRSTVHGKNAWHVRWPTLLWPTTRSYNIGLTYELVIKVKFEIAGKSREIKTSHPVTVLPMSREKMREAAEKQGLVTMEDGLKKRDQDWIACGAGDSMAGSIGEVWVEGIMKQPDAPRF